MRVAFLILSPLLLLGGCATAGMGPHEARAQRMENCPMASPPSGDQQQPGMMEGKGGKMMDQGQMQGQMMKDMHQGDMPNCPMMQGAAPAPARTPTAPADPHQH